jgi:hypothetical protein
MHRFAKIVCSITLALGMASFAAADEIADELLVPAESLDDGLGELPTFAEVMQEWFYAMPAEKIDSGLGELPSFTQGMEERFYTMPAENIDSGLGELPTFAQVMEERFYARPAEKTDSRLGETTVRRNTQTAGR